MKQNRYPALLLTQGINSKYDDYYDPRTWTIKNGSNFVAMSEILGVAAMADDIQRDPSQVFLISRVFFFKIKTFHDIQFHEFFSSTFFRFNLLKKGVKLFLFGQMTRMIQRPLNISKNLELMA